MSKYDKLSERYDKADNEQRMTFLSALEEIERLEVENDDLKTSVKVLEERVEDLEAKLEEINSRRAYG